MPKSKETYWDNAPAEFEYPNPQSMPWPEIEAKTGKKFAKKDRAEIHRCRVIYDAHRNMVRDGASVSEVEALRKNLLESARALSDIRKRYRPTTVHHRSESDETVFLALAHSLHENTVGLTTLLGAAADPCDALIDALSNANLNDAETTAQDGEVVGLAHFIADALNGSKKTTARSNPNYNKNPTVFEHHRWGLHLGPQGGDLPAFASAVLGRPVSQNQIQHAFQVARDKGLIPC